MTLNTSSTDALGARRDRRAAATDGPALTRAEYRRLAAQRVEAERAEAERLEAEQFEVEAVVAASLVEQIVVEAAASALPLRRTRSNRTRSVVESSTPEFLSEPVVLPSATSTHVSADQPGPSIDEFELAARVFSFTGETPIQVARAAADAEPVVQTGRIRAASLPPKPRRGKIMLQRAAAASFSATVVGVVGMLMVGTTVPVSAVSAFGPAATGDVSILAPQKASAKT